MSTRNVVLAGVWLVALLGLVGCGKEKGTPGTGTGSPTPEPELILEPPENAVDFTEAAKGEAFQKVVQAMTKELGAEGNPIEAMPGGLVFAVPHDRVERSLATWHETCLKQGAYLFRLDNNFNIGGQPDLVGLLPTTDKYDVLRAVGTDGINYDLTNAKVIAWLQDLEKTHPFVLTGAGMDFVEGRFLTPPADALALAKRMYKFCPDIVDQGTGDVEKLATELQTGVLYFWWD